MMLFGLDIVKRFESSGFGLEHASTQAIKRLDKGSNINNKKGWVELCEWFKQPLILVNEI